MNTSSHSSAYEISADKSRLNLERVHDFLGNRSYWALGISREVVEKSIKHSLCFGIYHPQDGQVGFARVITDYATFAYLADVFVMEEHRMFGLSKRLMEYIVNHPELQGLRRFLLITKDAQRLYERYGFRPIANADYFMQIYNSNVYQVEKKTDEV